MAKLPNFDAHAVVVDNHTGRVLGTFQGLGAEEDARAFARRCQMGGVKHMSNTSIITGNEAKKAAANGRV